MHSYFDGMLRYFEFSGRSTRRQYWLFWLVAGLAGVCAACVDYQLYGHWPTDYDRPGPFFAFSTIIHVIPGVTVTVRRLHDLDRSGWWYWIQMVPLIGALILLYWMICGPAESNRFGHDPREELAAAPRHGASTIPRRVRMGSSAPRTPVHNDSGAAQRFI